MDRKLHRKIPAHARKKNTGLFTSICRGTASHNVHLTENSPKLKTVYNLIDYKKGYIIDPYEFTRHSNAMLRHCSKAEPMPQHILQKGLYHRPHEFTRLSNAMLWHFSLAEPMPQPNRLQKGYVKDLTSATFADLQ